MTSKIDCVAIVSGGMDSVSLLYYLVKRQGLSPAVITFEYGPKLGLSGEVFAHALSEWANAAPITGPLPLKDIVYGARSPGAVFRLDEDSVVSYLKELGRITKSSFTFLDTPDVRAVNRKKAGAAWSLFPAGARA